MNILEKKDLKIIKQFLENYEILIEKYDEYRITIESIRKNIIFQKYDGKIDEYNEVSFNKEQLEEEIKKQTDEYRKRFLIEQKKTLEDNISKLEKYNESQIEEKYIEIYAGNLKKYFKPKKEKEKQTIIYEPKEEILEKDYYYNEQTTITQIYTRIKYLYDFYEEEYSHKFFLESEFIEKNIKFFKKFKRAIMLYNEENELFIQDLLFKISETSKEKTMHK